jgi:hypothetical protein
MFGCVSAACYPNFKDFSFLLLFKGEESFFRTGKKTFSRRRGWCWCGHVALLPAFFQGEKVESCAEARVVSSRNMKLMLDFSRFLREGFNALAEENFHVTRSTSGVEEEKPRLDLTSSTPEEFQ